MGMLDMVPFTPLVSFFPCLFSIFPQEIVVYVTIFVVEWFTLNYKKNSYYRQIVLASSMDVLMFPCSLSKTPTFAQMLKDT